MGPESIVGLTLSSILNDYNKIRNVLYPNKLNTFYF